MYIIALINASFCGDWNPGLVVHYELGNDVCTFTRLSSSDEAPKVVTGGSFFSRGSRFRYSGRTEREMMEMTAGIYRHPPPVSRSASFRSRTALAQQLSPANTSDDEFAADGIGFTALTRSCRNSTHTDRGDGVPMNSPYYKGGKDVMEHGGNVGLQLPLSSLSEGSESNRSSAHNVNVLGRKDKLKLGRSKDDSVTVGIGNSSSGQQNSASTTKQRRTRSASTSSTSSPSTTEAAQDFHAELKALVEYKTPTAPRFRFLTDLRKALAGRNARNFILPGLAISFVAVAVLTVVMLECDVSFLAEFKESQEMVTLQQRYYEPLKSFFSRNFFPHS
ncbi:unnamed protein product [Notodromas monacha]|uniref:FERM adjacent domain-containing protein n=1 Tax=Notodromas monacha TaxID=399045 RepID=A0A7R9GFK5_9CRUS|nr:unnamed protein product [Notodromas monacha]CAG0920773.1 unnamed protein product [Notodromas monacha]